MKWNTLQKAFWRPHIQWALFNFCVLCRKKVQTTCVMVVCTISIVVKRWLVGSGSYFWGVSSIRAPIYSTIFCTISSNTIFGKVRPSGPQYILQYIQYNSVQYILYNIFYHYFWVGSSIHASIYSDPCLSSPTISNTQWRQPFILIIMLLTKNLLHQHKPLHCNDFPAPSYQRVWKWSLNWTWHVSALCITQNCIFC